MRAFRKVDVNGDGFISNSELRKMLTTVHFFVLIFQVLCCTMCCIWCMCSVNCRRVSTWNAAVVNCLIIRKLMLHHPFKQLINRLKLMLTSARPVIFWEHIIVKLCLLIYKALNRLTCKNYTLLTATLDMYAVQSMTVCWYHGQFGSEAFCVASLAAWKSALDSQTALSLLISKPASN